MKSMESILMKGFDRRKSGQFVIISALIIATFTLSLVLSIHQISINNKGISHQPVEELVLGVTSDLDRCLTRALSLATNKYDETGDIYSALNVGNNFIIKWVNSTITAYSNIGLKMMMKETPEGKTDIYWGIDWGYLGGASTVSLVFSTDINSYGFKGWVGRSGKTVFLDVLDNSSNSIMFQVYEGKSSEVFKPVDNLMPEYVQIKLKKGGWVDASVTELKYIGEGTYNASFTPAFDFSKEILNITVKTPDDKIVVGAYILNRSYYVDIGEWRTLYLSQDPGTGPVIVPYKIVKEGHVTKYQNEPHPVFGAVSPSTPFDITLAQLVNVTIFLGVDPNKNVRTVWVELNITYNGMNYTIGKVSHSYEGDGAYKFILNTSNVINWPTGYIDNGRLVVPYNSTILLTVAVEYSNPPYGSVKVYFGPDKPTGIDLF
jgi:hypothetical protein